jgi:hypothetical protein
MDSTRADDYFTCIGYGSDHSKHGSDHDESASDHDTSGSEHAYSHADNPSSASPLQRKADR